jgi:hypothetical protein
MHVQAIEGYLENGQFYPLGQLERKSGKIRAILTVLDEPIKQEESFPPETRTAWLVELKKMISESFDEKLPDAPSRQPMKQPHDLTDA